MITDCHKMASAVYHVNDKQETKQIKTNCYLIYLYMVVVFIFVWNKIKMCCCMKCWGCRNLRAFMWTERRSSHTDIGSSHIKCWYSWVQESSYCLYGHIYNHVGSFSLLLSATKAALDSEEWFVLTIHELVQMLSESCEKPENKWLPLYCVPMY